MKRSKNAFGYQFSDENVTIKVLTNVSFGEKNNSIVVCCAKTNRSISTRTIKSARIIATDFDEYYKIYNRNKLN
jgi:hypothetical protein